MDPDDFAVDVDAARPFQGRQVLERAPLRLLGIGDDVTRGAQRVEVDGLCSRSGGCLSLVEGASVGRQRVPRSEEHTSELQSLMRISYAVFCLKKTHNQRKSKI